MKEMDPQSGTSRPYLLSRRSKHKHGPIERRQFRYQLSVRHPPNRMSDNARPVLPSRHRARIRRHSWTLCTLGHPLLEERNLRRRRSRSSMLRIRPRRPAHIPCRPSSQRIPFRRPPPERTRLHRRSHTPRPRFRSRHRARTCCHRSSRHTRFPLLSRERIALRRRSQNPRPTPPSQRPPHRLVHPKSRRIRLHWQPWAKILKRRPEIARVVSHPGHPARIDNRLPSRRRSPHRKSPAKNARSYPSRSSNAARPWQALA